EEPHIRAMLSDHAEVAGNEPTMTFGVSMPSSPGVAPRRNDHVEWPSRGDGNSSRKFFVSPTAYSAVGRSKNISERTENGRLGLKPSCTTRGQPPCVVVSPSATGTRSGKCLPYEPFS